MHLVIDFFVLFYAHKFIFRHLKILILEQILRYLFRIDRDRLLDHLIIQTPLYDLRITDLRIGIVNAEFLANLSGDAFEQDCGFIIILCELHIIQALIQFIQD